MKKIILALALFCTLASRAQTDSIQPAYLRFPTLPPFELLGIDSTTIIGKDDLPRKQPVLIMFFSPDCDHCKHQMDDMLKEMDSFKDIQIVMATFQPFALMKAFYEKYNLSKYPNIRMGRDTKYFLPPFYRMYNLPYLALYNRKGQLITTFEGNVKPVKLLEEFKR